MPGKARSMNRFKKWVVKGLLIFGIFLLLVVFLSSEAYFFMAVGHKVIFWQDFLYNAVRWLPWAFLTPFVLRLVKRFPLAKRSLGRPLAVHIPASLILAVAEVGIVYGVHALTRWRFVEGTALAFMVLLAKYIHYNVLAYWVIAGIGLATGYYRKYHEQQIASSRLEAELARANLRVLKMQVHPHFLFNTLHAVSALIPKDPKAADVMLSRLSDLLRLTVEQSGVQEVPWREEEAALDRYLDIMRVRLGDRLRLRLDVSPEAREALVPSFLLQPLVENAVRYAISSRPEGGRLFCGPSGRALICS